MLNEQKRGPEGCMDFGVRVVPSQAAPPLPPPPRPRPSTDRWGPTWGGPPRLGDGGEGGGHSPQRRRGAGIRWGATTQRPVRQDGRTWGIGAGVPRTGLLPPINRSYKRSSQRGEAKEIPFMKQ